MEKYNHKKIEQKWQKKWEKEKLYQTSEDKAKPKYYVLDMFPYPSGAGLHVGHPKGYIATDIFARAKMMQGYNVLHPMGWDAFGLPAENYAIANKIHPRTATEKNIATFKRQLGLLGFTYDWDREINTTDPEFYKWTQWIFIKMFERGLAYESNEPVNWCPSCKTVLSNEDLENGKCERCGSEVEQRPMRQWVLKITDYADRLLNDLEKLPDWEESIKEMQRNWIGRSEGATVKFKVESLKLKVKKELEVFTTRPDTLFGATFMVIAPEHPLVKEITTDEQKKEVEKYIKKSAGKSDMERTELAKEKTGVFTGAFAINPVNEEKIPVYIADYVMMGYGTGAIMAVPAHDGRDFEFAVKYNLPIKQVVRPEDILKSIIVAETAEQGLKDELTKNKIEFTIGLSGNGREHIRIILKERQVNEFIKTVQKYLKGGAWAEIIGVKNILIFKDEVFENFQFDDAKLFERLKQAEPLVRKYNNIWEMLRHNLFYEELVCYVGDGIGVNSDFLNGLETVEAKEKIINWLEEKKLGKRTVNYKIKDWVFSRQRYWGEPIPIVRCQACKEKKYKYLFLHGRHGSSQKDFFPWLRRELEALGHEVYSPDLPDTEDPKVAEQADFVLKNYKIDKDTIIVAHSLGGAAAFNLLEKANKKVARAVLVDTLIYPKFNDKKRPDLEKNFHWQFDFKKIKKLSDEFIDLADSNFPIITKEQFTEKNELLNTRLIYVKPNNNHFNSDIEPSVLKYAVMDGIYTVPEDELPLKLPEVKNYEPTGTGESPLANIKEWVNTTCPKCGGRALRETNTMPQWAGSSWYFLRFIDPHNDKALVDKAKDKYWSPVDFYVGGAEHATRHLIYARFWHKFLYDIGAVNYDEPFTRLQHVGLILAEDGRKMSKRWNNVINPDEIVEKFGADSMRVYEMFMGPFSQPCAWSTNGLIGARRFLENVYKFKDKKLYDCKGGDCKIKELGLPQILHKTIKKITQDIEKFHYNTAIAQMMIFVNFAGKFDSMPRAALEKFLILLAPFAPHLAEELWSELGNKQSIFKQNWPKFNPDLVKDETVNLVIQVNGKVRDTIESSADISEESAKKIALASEKIKKWLGDKEVVKVIFVKGKLVNIVAK